LRYWAPFKPEWGPEDTLDKQTKYAELWEEHKGDFTLLNKHRRTVLRKRNKLRAEQYEASFIQIEMKKEMNKHRHLWKDEAEMTSFLQMGMASSDEAGNNNSTAGNSADHAAGNSDNSTDDNSEDHHLSSSLFGFGGEFHIDNSDHSERSSSSFEPTTLTNSDHSERSSSESSEQHDASSEHPVIRGLNEVKREAMGNFSALLEEIGAREHQELLRRWREPRSSSYVEVGVAQPGKPRTGDSTASVKDETAFSQTVSQLKSLGQSVGKRLAESVQSQVAGKKKIAKGKKKKIAGSKKRSGAGKKSKKASLRGRRTALKSRRGGKKGGSKKAKAGVGKSGKSKTTTVRSSNNFDDIRG